MAIRKRALALAITLFILLVCTSCSERVNPGYVGMVLKSTGLTGELLPPGNWSCWGRDRLVVIPTAEYTITEKLSVLCADDLNFKFDLKVRSRLKKSSAKEILDLLNRQGAKIKWGKDSDVGMLTFAEIYNTYVQPAARPTARSTVSKYQTTQIRNERKNITDAIRKELLIKVKGTPIELTLLETSNFDYPEVITKAVEEKRKREISIDQEKAQQAIELLKADNRLKIAQKMKAVRAAEASADAAAINILGKALTPEYLNLKRIERDTALYLRVAQGDKVIITNGNQVSPIIGAGNYLAGK